MDCNQDLIAFQIQSKYNRKNETESLGTCHNSDKLEKWEQIKIPAIYWHTQYSINAICNISAK